MSIRTTIFAGLVLLSADMCYSQEGVDSIPGQQLQEVVVTGQSAFRRVADIRLGTEMLELSKLAETPALFGENDIVKSIALMPGVHSEGEGAGGFEVRGGTSAQNLVLLDGITLYNPAHVMGIFSTFNDNAIGRATLYKGPLPPGYGGATSAVLETNLASGDMDGYHASGTIGVLAAKIMASGPVVRDKLSFAVTARRSYVDLFLKMIPKYSHTVMNFYDLTAKFRYTPRRGDYLDVSLLASRDNMGISDFMSMRWGNIGASVNWIVSRGERWRIVTTGAFTDYTADMGMAVMRVDRQLSEYIRNWSVGSRAVYLPDEGHEFEVGVRSELLNVKSGEFEVNSVREKEIRSGWQNVLWFGYEGRLGRGVSLSGGLRMGLFSALAGNTFNDFVAVDKESPAFPAKSYFDAEPRISLKYDFSELHNLKVGAALTSQNIHAIRSSFTSFPFDRYALTSSGVRPERAVQYGCGYAGMSPDGGYDWSVEGYYKSVSNVYDYRDGRSMFSDINLEDIILGGCGRSYGMEFMFRKNLGRLTGWVAYTLSKTQTRIAGINDGRWYAASNDRRHNASVVALYQIDSGWTFSASWTFSSGQPITAPDMKYEIDGATCYYYSRRNGYRTPPSHRLDLSATYTRQGRRFTTQWSFGIYNAYCRLNPFVVYFEDDDTKPSGTRAVQQSLYGIIPSVSYTLKF